jgi:hypothetical protein
MWYRDPDVNAPDGGQSGISDGSRLAMRTLIFSAGALIVLLCLQCVFYIYGTIVLRTPFGIEIYLGTVYALLLGGFIASLIAFLSGLGLVRLASATLGVIYTALILSKVI